MSDDRPASVADIVVEELRKKEINGPDSITKKGFLHSWPEAEGQGPVAHSLRLRSGIRRHVDTCARDAGVVRQASNDCAANKFGRWLPSSYGPREQGRYAVEFYTTVKTAYVYPGGP